MFPQSGLIPSANDSLSIVSAGCGVNDAMAATSSASNVTRSDHRPLLPMPTFMQIRKIGFRRSEAKATENPAPKERSTYCGEAK